MEVKFSNLWLATATITMMAILAVPFVPAVRAQPQTTGDGGEQAQAPAGNDREGMPRRQGGRGPGVFGKISAIQKDAIEVTSPDGAKVSVRLTDKTEFRKDRQPAKFADFKVGDNVMVRTDQEAARASGATALVVAGVPAGFTGRGGSGGSGGMMAMMGTMGKDFVVGEVKSVDPPKIVVVRTDGVTQTLELNEDTSLRRGRDSITMADIQPGDHIFARGGAANDAFSPKNVNVIPPEMWKRMQEMNEGKAPQGAAAPSAPPTAQQNPPGQPN